MAKKELYAGKYIFDCRYVKGWLFKRIEQKTIKVRARSIVLAEIPKKAIDKFISNYENEYDDTLWNSSKLPWRITWTQNIPGNAVTLDRHVEVYPTMMNIESLKEKMDANEFLAYCRQELLDPIEVING